jgi:SEC-C motif-containing protein
MRSRYTAYVLDELDYLRDTWHPRTRPARLEPNPANLRWLGLDVKRHVPLGEKHATVEFVARSKLGGRATRMHEISRFERIEGRWIYVGGSPG